MTRDDYDRLHATSPQRSIFGESWWLDIAAGGADGWSPNIARDDENRTVAAWPLVERITSHGRVGTLAPYTPYVGPVLAPRADVAAVEQVSDEVRQLELLARVLATHAHVESACMPELRYVTPLAWHDYEWTTRTTWRIAAPCDEAQARATLRASTRKALSRAERHGMSVRTGTVDELLRAWSGTFARQQQRDPDRAVLRALAAAALERGRGSILAVDSPRGELAAAGLFVWDERITWSLAHGRTRDVDAPGAPTVLVWNAILQALARGTSFDFEGSMLRPVEQFVRGFGGVPFTYHVLRRSSPAWRRVVRRRRTVRRLLRR